MDTTTGKFHSTDEVEKMVQEGRNREDFVFFMPGDMVMLKGYHFIISDLKNGRIILRPEKVPPTLREKRLLDYKEYGKSPKSFTIRNGSLVHDRE